MLVLLGILGTVLGLALAAFAHRMPSRRPMIEKWGGGLFVVGIALLGAAFPML